MRISPFARLTAALVAMLALGACDWMQKKASPRATSIAQNRTTLFKNACASRAAYDRLVKYAFDEAIRIRNADPVNLATLAAYSVVRMEAPVVKSRDEALDVTVCSGRFVLELPPGAERGFGGERRLVADVEYAAQPAADGSGLVYRVRGAEPIIYKLAAFDLRAKPAGPPIAGEQAMLTWIPPAEAPALPVAAVPAVADAPPAVVQPAARSFLASAQWGAAAPKETPEPAAAPRPVKLAEAPKPEPKKAAPKLAAKPATKAAPKAKEEPTRHASAVSKPKAKPVREARASKAPAKPVREARAAPKAKPKAVRQARATSPSKAAKSLPVRQAKVATKPKASPVREASVSKKKKTPPLRIASAAPRAKAAPKAKPVRQAAVAPRPRPSRMRSVAAALASLEQKPAAPVRQAKAAPKRKRSGVSELESVIAAAPPAPTKSKSPPVRVAARSKLPALRQLASASPAPARVQQAAVVQKPRAPATQSSPCGYTRSRSEFLICSNQKLAQLDRRMASLLSSAMRDADGWARSELSRTRSRFLNWRDRCSDSACIEDAYVGRMEEIRDIMADARF